MKKGKKKMTENINLQNNQPTVKGGLMSRFNHNNIFEVDTKDFKWVDLKTLFNTDPDKQYTLLGLFVKGSKFGKEPDAIINGFKVNLPRHLLDTVNDMLDDNQVIEAIKAGKVGFKIYSYHSNVYNKDAYSVTWLDL